MCTPASHLTLGRYEAVRACKWVDELVLNVPYSFDTQEELQQ